MVCRREKLDFNVAALLFRKLVVGVTLLSCAVFQLWHLGVDSLRILHSTAGVPFFHCLHRR